MFGGRGFVFFFRILEGFMIYKWLSVIGLEGLCILRVVKVMREMRYDWEKVFRG